MDRFFKKIIIIIKKHLYLVVGFCRFYYNHSMKNNKLSLIISIISVVLASAVGLVLYFVLKPAQDSIYMYFKKDSLTLNLYQEIDLDDIELVTNIEDLSKITFETTNTTVEVNQDRLVAKAVGSDKLTCKVVYNNKTYTAKLDLLVKFDGVDSVVQVSTNATKQGDDYILYLPNKNYSGEDVYNCALININFLDDNFVSQVSYTCNSNPSEQDRTFNTDNSFDNNVITIQDNKVKAVGLGRATLNINFVDTNLSTSISFVVKQILPTQISVAGGDLEVSVSQTQVALPSVTIMPQYATITACQISIADEDIIKLNGQHLQPLSQGNTTITFSCGGVSKTINVSVSAMPDRIDVNVLEEFDSNTFVTVEYALYCGDVQVDGEVGVVFLVDGDEYDELDFVNYYEIFATTIDFDLGIIEDFTIRIYSIVDDSIYYDIEVFA